MEKFRVGLIGTGGRCGSHMSALSKMDDVQVVAVADPIEERRVAAAQKMGATRLYKDHREFYAHESAETLDAIWICIEPTAHDELTEMGAVERGIPFLVEKPMTLDLEMGDKIAKAIEEKNLITAVGFQDRYLDLVNMINCEAAEFFTLEKRVLLIRVTRSTLSFGTKSHDLLLFEFRYMQDKFA